MPRTSRTMSVSRSMRPLAGVVSAAVVNDAVGRHSRLQDAVGIGDRELDAEDELQSLLGRLDVLRRELCLVVDSRDAGDERMAGECVDVDVRGITESKSADLRFGDVDLHIQSIEI